VDELTDELQVIGTIVRDALMECKIKKGKYWNIEVLDIRWFKDNKPTNKGIRLNMEEAKLLLSILRREIDEEN
jgi:hypothetical protein|tara:strand:+ start:246 stop:464 length:219 start_codon:yes stop_codon:yes gene_type:complete